MGSYEIYRKKETKKPTSSYAGITRIRCKGMISACKSKAPLLSSDVHLTLIFRELTHQNPIEDEMRYGTKIMRNMRGNFRALTRGLASFVETSGGILTKALFLSIFSHLNELFGALPDRLPPESLYSFLPAL